MRALIKCGATQLKFKIEDAYQFLPIWVANCYQPQGYFQKEIIMKSGDGGLGYCKDAAFLKACFLWSCLTDKNQVKSTFEKSNQFGLCQESKADNIYYQLQNDGLIDDDDKDLVNHWSEIINMIKTTPEYKHELIYGLKQLILEINIKVPTGRTTKAGEPILKPKYIPLDTKIKDFKIKLKKYFDAKITPQLFKYELLK